MLKATTHQTREIMNNNTTKNVVYFLRILWRIPEERSIFKNSIFDIRKKGSGKKGHNDLNREDINKDFFINLLNKT